MLTDALVERGVPRDDAEGYLKMDAQTQAQKLQFDHILGRRVDIENPTECMTRRVHAHFSPVTLAIRHGFPRVLAWILEHGVRITFIDETVFNGDSLLDTAIDYI